MELNDEQCKELDFLFHTKDYEDIYKIQSGLRNIADHVNNVRIASNLFTIYICESPR